MSTYSVKSVIQQNKSKAEKSPVACGFVELDICVYYKFMFINFLEKLIRLKIL